MRLWQMAEGQRLVVHVDRQGGRVRYLEALGKVFEGCSFKVLEEDDTRSSYRITDPSAAAKSTL